MDRKLINIQDGTSSTSSFSQEQQQQQASSSSSGLPGGIPQNLLLHPTNQRRDGPPPLFPGALYTQFFSELLYYQWRKPLENTIDFWTEYARRFYDPLYVETICLSNCNSEHSAPWNQRMCQVCRCQPARGFWANFETLPANLKYKFDYFLIADRYTLPWSSQYEAEPGLTVLVAQRARHTMIARYEKIICEGILRVVITRQWKILSWDYCIQSREVHS